MTRPLGTRDRKGWLTPRALTSGLREQYAHYVGHERRRVDLYCVPRPTPTFIVEYHVGSALVQTHTFTELPLAHARYVALVHKAKRPIPGKEQINEYHLA